MADFDREAVRAFMALNRISLAAFARHADVPYATIYAVMGGRKPRPRTRIRMSRAIEQPLVVKMLKHAVVVRALWGERTSDEIGRLCGVSGARIRDVAKRMGISNRSNHG